jgi:ubiquinone/menaquinone biosynthesis C-methylase UbiE
MVAPRKYTIAGDGNDPVSAVARAYDSAAPFYDKWPWQAFWRRNESPLVLNLIGTELAGSRIIDIGAGTGYYVNLLQLRGANVVGADVSLAMLRIARRKTRAKVAVASATELPFRSGQFNVALLLRVLSHIDDADAAFAEVARVIRRGGKFVLTDVSPEHHFSSTVLPSARGKTSVMTIKRQPAEVQATAARHSFGLIESQNITAQNAQWLPPSDQLQSIERGSDRPVGYLQVFEKS